MRDGKQLTDEKTIIAVEGESYPLAWRDATKYRLDHPQKEDLVGVTFRCIPQDSMDTVVMQLLAPNTLSGYEWRQVQAAFAFDPQSRDLLIYSELYVDGSTTWNSSDKTMNFNHIPEYPALHQEAGFTVNHNGVDYSGCAFCTTGNFVGDYGKTTKESFILLPEGYSNSISIILTGYNSKKIRFDF